MSFIQRGFRAAGLALTAAVALSCEEHLPSGPNTFSATLAIVVAHDTIVVGDNSNAVAQVSDASGHLIRDLSFVWATADPSIVDFIPLTTSSTAADTAGRTKTLRGRKPGRTTVSITLPDSRFVTSMVSRNETVVVGGVRILSSHDTTLTAINDTATAIGTSLTRVNGALVNTAAQGLQWVHLGTHTSVVLGSDSVRYIARSNGADTIIATHQLCLAGAKCADTVVVRVAQQLTLTLSTRTLRAWSFGDTLGPTVTLADRRGSGLFGTSVQFLPAGPVDLSVIRVTPPVGVSNPANGAMAAPQLVSIGNGTAKVYVQGIGPDGFSVVALDSITETVRQVARRIAIEPLRAVITMLDSIPVRRIARDARGSTIADATVTATPSGIALNDNIWAVPFSVGTSSILPDLTGIALPANNPLAPQIPPSIDGSFINTIPRDTAVAGATARTVSVQLIDSLGRFGFGQWVRFGVAPTGPVPDSAQGDGSGLVTAVWVPRDTSGFYTLTGVRGAIGGANSAADSAGHVVLRRTMLVIPDVPSDLKSTLGVSATTVAVGMTATVTVILKDQFGNPIYNAKPTDFTLTASVGGGTFGPISCSLNVCTAIYTAPAAAGPDAISARIGAVEIAFSPIAMTITP